MLKALPEAQLLEHEEVLRFLEARRLYGRGIGWVGCSSLGFDVAHTVLPLDLRQAAAQSSGCLERPGMNFPKKITRRWSQLIDDVVLEFPFLKDGSAALR